MQRHLLAALVVLMVAATAMAVDNAGPAKGVVNINTATSDQLQLLPRIGPALAQRIINFREVNGAFATVDELVAVKGIGDRSLELLRPYLATEGSTTLTDKIRLPRQSRAEES
jgi:comEA protein